MPNLPTSITPFGRGVKSLPYDAEVEWLQGDGHAYIDTGLRNIMNSVVTARFMRTSATLGVGNDLIFSCRINNKSQELFVSDITEGMLRCYYSTQSNPLVGIDFRTIAPHSQIGIWYDLTINASQASISCGSLNFQATGNVVPAFQTDGNILLWKVNWRDWAPGTSRIAYLKSEEICDFIPVRVGQVGYMYDRVSRQLFGNAGTGSFIVGPDKNG